MSKNMRVRTPHYITPGIGAGDIKAKQKVRPEESIPQLRKNLKARTADRLAAQEHPADRWSEIYFQNSPPSGDNSNYRKISSHHRNTSGGWEIFALALLGGIVLLSAIFLNLVAEDDQLKRRSRKQSPHKIVKKKTDEWNADVEEELLSESIRMNYRSENKDSKPTLYYPYQPKVQQHRHRKLSANSGGAAGTPEDSAPSAIHHRNLYPNQSESLASAPRQTASATNTPQSIRPTTEINAADSSYCPPDLAASVPPPPPPLHPPVQYSPPAVPSSQLLSARILSNASSFTSIEGSTDEKSKHNHHDVEVASPMRPVKGITWNQQRHTDKTSTVLLSPGTDDVTPVGAQHLKLAMSDLVDQTPRIGNKRTANVQGQFPLDRPGSNHLPYSSAAGVPFLPSLTTNPRQGLAPPKSINIDDLHLYQLMESGNVTHWEARAEQQRGRSERQFIPGKPLMQTDKMAESSNSLLSSDEETDDVAELASDDPRRAIKHKRSDLRMSTNASKSLQSSIPFNELKMIEVIGTGGFGSVYKALWRGTPVAVKVLSGSSQTKNVPKIILQEFSAEINLLKGMRHPNICLYMGACLEPPNRAIVTELAENGSLWDALRLPLNPPFMPCDGTSRTSWPEALYEPDSRHGAPPISTPRQSVPVPSKDTWPWELVKRVALGSARGMAYLHSGEPPILHRDLKSANILLDLSYTPKVCDFGLSRLKAHERSMTGNCGTVQWMAPEVLGNSSYNEKADIYSYGIILWELLSRECPFDGMTPIQCALAVLNRNQRPEIPRWCPHGFQALIRSCIKREPKERPTFGEIIDMLNSMP